MSRFRAIETGRPLVRVANTGVTAVIDGYGRVIDSAPVNAEIALAVDVPFGAASVPLYSYLGDWFAYAASLAWLFLLAWAYASRPRRPGPSAALSHYGARFEVAGKLKIGNIGRKPLLAMLTKPN